MPTYDYECDACGNAWELFQMMSADPVKECPKCGKKKARRLIGAGAGIVFKGSGFYETDYRSSGYNKAAEADKKASESKATSTADAKTDSKSDANSETPAKKPKASGGGGKSKASD